MRKLILAGALAAVMVPTMPAAEMVPVTMSMSAALHLDKVGRQCLADCRVVLCAGQR